MEAKQQNQVLSQLNKLKSDLADRIQEAKLNKATSIKDKLESFLKQCDKTINAIMFLQSGNLNRANKNIESSKNCIVWMTEQITATGKYSSATNGQIEQFNKTISRFCSDIEQSTTQLQSIESFEMFFSRLDEAMRDLKEQYQAIQRLLDQAQTQREQERTELKGINQKKGVIQNELKKKAEELDDLKNETSSCETTIASIQTKLKQEKEALEKALEEEKAKKVDERQKVALQDKLSELKAKEMTMIESQQQLQQSKKEIKPEKFNNVSPPKDFHIQIEFQYLTYLKKQRKEQDNYRSILEKAIRENSSILNKHSMKSKFAFYTYHDRKALNMKDKPAIPEFDFSNPDCNLYNHLPQILEEMAQSTSFYKILVLVIHQPLNELPKVLNYLEAASHMIKNFIVLGVNSCFETKYLKQVADQVERIVKAGNNTTGIIKPVDERTKIMLQHDRQDQSLFGPLRNALSQIENIKNNNEEHGSDEEESEIPDEEEEKLSDQEKRLNTELIGIRDKIREVETSLKDLNKEEPVFAAKESQTSKFDSLKEMLDLRIAFRDKTRSTMQALSEEIGKLKEKEEELKKAENQATTRLQISEREIEEKQKQAKLLEKLSGQVKVGGIDLECIARWLKLLKENASRIESGIAEQYREWSVPQIVNGKEIKIGFKPPAEKTEVFQMFLETANYELGSIHSSLQTFIDAK